MAREPFEPPFTRDDLPELDTRHQNIGLGREWFESEARADLSGVKVYNQEFTFPSGMAFTTTHIYVLKEDTIDEIAEKTGTSKNLLKFRMGEAAAEDKFVMIYVQEIR